MKKFVFTMLGLMLVVAGSTAMSGRVSAAGPSKASVELSVQEGDRVIGEKNAPVKIVEYASLTCGHCADFHNKSYPKLKEEYIDTGKVMLIMRQFPLNGLDLAVSKVVQCASEEHYYNFVSAFMGTQENWVRSSAPLDEVKRIARLGGMSSDKVEKCIRDEELSSLLQERAARANEILGVRGTPTFFINGERYNGSYEFEVLKKEIDKELAK